MQSRKETDCHKNVTTARDKLMDVLYAA